MWINFDVFFVVKICSKLHKSFALKIRRSQINFLVQLFSLLLMSWNYNTNRNNIGITFKKIFCYMRESACRCLIVENAKIFRSYIRHF